jgi:predicted HTH transcriptional regulator
MDKYVFILSKTYGCYKMKKLLPKRFRNVDLKMDKEYKKWKKAEDKKFDDKIVKFDDKRWWDSLDKNKRKEYIDKYGNNLDNLFAWKHRMTYHGGLCKTYKIIDETFFT